MIEYLMIQRQITKDNWSVWEIPPNDRVEAHKALLATSKEWFTDMFRLVLVREIELARNGELLQREIP